jgi:cobalamin biosynthesis protein CbiG
VDVADYRLYGLDGVDKVASGEWFEAADDETAIEVAKTLMDGHDCELWQGRRLVARIPHGRKS